MSINLNSGVCLPFVDTSGFICMDCRAPKLRPLFVTYTILAKTAVLVQNMSVVMELLCSVVAFVWKCWSAVSVPWQGMYGVGASNRWGLWSTQEATDGQLAPIHQPLTVLDRCGGFNHVRLPTCSCDVAITTTDRALCTRVQVTIISGTYCGEVLCHGSCPFSGKVTRMVLIPFFSTFPYTKILITSWDSSFYKSVIGCATEIRFPVESGIFSATTLKSAQGPLSECRPFFPPELASWVWSCFFRFI
jgi:hypothetical protein